MINTIAEQARQEAFERRVNELNPVHKAIVKDMVDKGDFLKAYDYLGSPEEPRFDVYYIPDGVKVHKARGDKGERYALERKYKKPYMG